jgi:ABC-type transport system involved in cytochrome bd biosynthesis fused ATPase/permease subunit
MTASIDEIQNLLAEWEKAKAAVPAAALVISREQDLRSFLGTFNFSGDMVKQAVGSMSGGEKARLVLAMIVWQRPNLLLLDEPTNHLDQRFVQAHSALARGNAIAYRLSLSLKTLFIRSQLILNTVFVKLSMKGLPADAKGFRRFCFISVK